MDGRTIEARLTALRREFEAGRRRLAECEAQATAVREQLLRISGAVVALEELLASPDPPREQAASVRAEA